MEDSKFPIKIKFTPGEWYLIADRLEIPECIAEALTDDMEDSSAAFYYPLYKSAAGRLLEGGRECEVRDNYELLALLDAVEGSTMPAKLIDQTHEGYPEEQREARNLLKHIRAIEKKLADAGYPETRFPRESE